MIRLLAAILLTASPQPWFTTVLQFSDGSTELCASSGWQWNGVALTVQVQSCEPDVIFANGFED